MRISRFRIDLEGGRVDNAVVNNSTLSGTTVATQADQEAASSTSVAVTPGRQHFHPGHPKCWVHVTGGGSPTVSTSYNVTSVTDVGTGLMTVNIATDMSGTSFCAVGSIQSYSDNGQWDKVLVIGNLTAGTIPCRCVDVSSGGGTANPSEGYMVMALGDQA